MANAHDSIGFMTKSEAARVLRRAGSDKVNEDIDAGRQFITLERAQEAARVLRAGVASSAAGGRKRMSLLTQEGRRTFARQGAFARVHGQTKARRVELAKAAVKARWDAVRARRAAEAKDNSEK